MDTWPWQPALLHQFVGDSLSFILSCALRWGTCAPCALCLYWLTRMQIMNWVDAVQWTGLTPPKTYIYGLLCPNYVQTMYRSVQIVLSTCNLLTFIRTWYAHIHANTYMMGKNSPVQTGSFFCTYCTYLHVYACLYIHICAITCKIWPHLNRGVLASSESKSTYWHVSYRYFFTYKFICNSYVVVQIENKYDTKYIHALFVCILMVPAAHFKGCLCAVHRDTMYTYIPVSTITCVYVHIWTTYVFSQKKQTANLPSWNIN